MGYYTTGDWIYTPCSSARRPGDPKVYLFTQDDAGKGIHIPDGTGYTVCREDQEGASRQDVQEDVETQRRWRVPDFAVPANPRFPAGVEIFGWGTPDTLHDHPRPLTAWSHDHPYSHHQSK